MNAHGALPAWFSYNASNQPIILKRGDFLRLKAVPKPPFEQLACLLGTDQGFRTGEVTQARLEDFDLDEGVVYVRDSKDKRLYPLPLSRETAYAYTAVDRRDGYVLTHHPRYSKWRGHAVTLRHYRNLVQRWARDAGVRDYSNWHPTLLRAYFAKEWTRPRLNADGHVTPGGDILILSKIMRHRNPYTTWVYLRKIVYVEDLRAEMERLYLPGDKPISVAQKDVSGTEEVTQYE